jgi:acetyltransferase-like isoleucine patch superfamily enzyme
MLEKFKLKLKNSPKMKNLLLWLMMPAHQARPRLWIKLFINPVMHKKGRGSCIRRNSRIDVFPANKFIVGKYSTIEDFSVINNGVGDVVVGNDTRIGMSNVVIGPVEIGDNVMTAQHVVLSGLNHGFEDVTLSPKDQKVGTAKIIVEDDVWIGANAVVVAGVTIGKHAIIGAGSVVTKSVPPFSVAVGNPAKIVKEYNSETKVWEKAQ